MASDAAAFPVDAAATAPAPISQLRGRYRQHLLLKTPELNRAFALARSILIGFAEENARPRLSIDIDPSSML